jgi:hypothetical protein
VIWAAPSAAQRSKYRYLGAYLSDRYLFVRDNFKERLLALLFHGYTPIRFGANRVVNRSLMVCGHICSPIRGAIWVAIWFDPFSFLPLSLMQPRLKLPPTSHISALNDVVCDKRVWTHRITNITAKIIQKRQGHFNFISFVQLGT